MQPMAHLCVASLWFKPHTVFVCLAVSPVRMRVHTDGTISVFFTLPFGRGFAIRANTKVSWFLIVHGAMLSLFLVLILLVFAVTCESH